jgi:Tfp pilus assembly protein PilF
MSKRKHAIDAHFQSGVRLHGAGRLQEAEQVYRQIIAANPGHADSLHMLGVIASQCGQPEAAVACIDRAIALKPSAALYHVNRASALLALGQLDAAEQGCREALRLKRNCAEAYQVLGHVLSDRGQPVEAVAAYRNAMQHNPRLPDLHNNLGLALREANQLETAAAMLRIAVDQEPKSVELRCNFAGVLKDLGQIDAAEAVYRQILVEHPDNAAAHNNLGILLLVAGRLAEGWEHWEWRFRAERLPTRLLSKPLWQGESLAGRAILLQAEQGMGDMIQFCRYAPLVAAGDGRIVLEVHQPLVRLMASLPGVAQVIAIGEAAPPFDLQCPMMSLPSAFGRRGEAQIPGTVPYLRADTALIAQWRRRTENLPGLKVGLVWAGNPERIRMDNRRSIRPDLIARLADVPEVQLISLQKGGALGGWRPAHDWTEELSDFADTAALIDTLDLVIGVDTAVVHLAGALGKPVWLLNRYDTCWRWQRGRDDSPWYPTLRQFRQKTPGDWDDVLATVAQELAALAEKQWARPGPALDDAAMRDEPHRHG